VVIAGGGVLGTMHAIAARRRGFEVVQLEREAEARGASVRNFGLVWVSGRKAGPELALALRARELWSELGAQVPGLGFRAAGSLTLATGDAELALLKETTCAPGPGRCSARPSPGCSGAGPASTARSALRPPRCPATRCTTAPRSSRA
jgi:succinate dehydrogenase/fumarate reductase flavoprotein subunit